MNDRVPLTWRQLRQYRERWRRHRRIRAARPSSKAPWWRLPRRAGFHWSWTAGKGVSVKAMVYRSSPCSPESTLPSEN